MSGNPKLRREAKRLTGEYLKRFGAEPDATQREAARRAGELMALAGSLRGAAITGGVDLIELNKIEAMAESAVAALPPPPANRISKIEVELIEGPGTAKERDRLKEENEVLREQLEAFRRQPASHLPSQPIDTPFSATPSQPATPSEPSNVVQSNPPRKMTKPI